MTSARRHVKAVVAVATIALLLVPAGRADDWFRDPQPGGVPTGASVRPDDRPQARGPGVAPQDVPTRITIQPGGFDWADAAVGAAVALGGVMLVSGLSLVARRHRRTSVATR